MADAARCDHKANRHVDCPWCGPLPAPEGLPTGVILSPDIPEGTGVVGPFTMNEPVFYHDAEGKCVNHQRPCRGCAQEDIPAGQYGEVRLVRGRQNGKRASLEAMETRHGNCRCGQVTDERGVVPHKTGSDPRCATQVVEGRSMRLIPYRTCCHSLMGLDAHEPHCAAKYFADGQRVVRRGWHNDHPFGNPPLRIKPDTVSSDRTFENETRLH